MIGSVGAPSYPFDPVSVPQHLSHQRLFGWRTKIRAGGHLNRRLGEHAQIPYSDAVEIQRHAFVNKHNIADWKAPTIYRASSNTESVVLVPIATQNLKILRTLGCPYNP